MNHHYSHYWRNAVTKTLNEFVAEKLDKEDHDLENKFKDVDCDCDLDELDEEAREYCQQKRMIKYINYAWTWND